jgi:hypothetical protein
MDKNAFIKHLRERALSEIERLEQTVQAVDDRSFMERASGALQKAQEKFTKSIDEALSSFAANEEDDIDQLSTSRQWIPFDGTAVDNGEVFLLASHDGEAVVEAASDGVRVNGALVEIAVGTSVVIKKQPKKTGIKPQFNASFMGPEQCPDEEKRWACIALVAICCKNGKVIGACFGAWPCD